MTNRRATKDSPPTLAFQAIQAMPSWQRAVLFVWGVAGISVLAGWFLFLDRDHTHSKPEWIGAAALGIWFAWCIAPEFITRRLDKYLPDKWRKDRRSA